MMTEVEAARRNRLEPTIEHSLVKALRRVPGFDVLDDRDLLRVVGASVNLSWPAGSMVFEKGSPGDALYIVLSGEVRIYDEVDGTEVEITRIGSGDFFGEISLLLDSEHTKNVQAVEDSELLVLMKDSFWALLEKRPDLAEIVQKRLEGRRAETRALYEAARH
jgi:CRP/FNR family transcriptional regulator, cyclic AMP receptor protein